MRTCDRIPEIENTLDFDPAGVVCNTDDAYARTTRAGDIAFVPHEERYQFMFNGIWYLISEANRTNWQFDLIGLLPLQYLIYHERHFFDWRGGTLSAPPDPARPGPPPVHELSLSLQLSEPDTYDGGNFEARGRDGRVDANFWMKMRQRGSLIIFPAAVDHRVTKVTRGARRSLVGWVLGQPSEEDLAFDPNQFVR